MDEQSYGKGGCCPNRKPTAPQTTEKRCGNYPCDGHSNGDSVQKARPAFHVSTPEDPAH